MEPKKILFALIGMAVETRESIGELAGELVERGKLLSDAADDPAARLLDKALGKPREAAKIVGEILRDAFDSIGLATAADAANLKDRLEQTEKMIARLKASSVRSERRR